MQWETTFMAGFAFGPLVTSPTFNPTITNQGRHAGRGGPGTGVGHTLRIRPREFGGAALASGPTRTSPLVSWVGLAVWAALGVGPPLWALVSGAPMRRALVGHRERRGGKIGWQTGTAALP